MTVTLSKFAAKWGVNKGQVSRKIRELGIGSKDESGAYSLTHDDETALVESMNLTIPVSMTELVDCIELPTNSAIAVRKASPVTNVYIEHLTLKLDDIDTSSLDESTDKLEQVIGMLSEHAIKRASSEGKADAKELVSEFKNLKAAVRAKKLQAFIQELEGSQD